MRGGGGEFKSPSDTVGISPGQSDLAPGVSEAGLSHSICGRAVTWGFVVLVGMGAVVPRPFRGRT